MLGGSSFSISRNGNFMPENLGQNVVSLIGKLCFSLFVIGVLIFTIIAATYNSEYPFFHPSTKITPFLTFKSDTNCGVNIQINCRDPDLFNLLMRSAVDKFKDNHFYRFGKPVPGNNDKSCHMAWLFRPKEEKSASFYKDYRSFTLNRPDNCTLSVVEIGEYHSGGNARKNKKPKRIESNPISLPIGETLNDGLPIIDLKRSFSEKKYLIYLGGGDRCKSMEQYLWSFLCMLGEARYLNRTLVMDLTLCLSKIYTSSGKDEEGKDFRFYFDFKYFKDSAPAVDQVQFWSDWTKWQQKDGLTLHLVEDLRTTPMNLSVVKDTLIMRKFEPDNNWFQVCQGEAESIIQRPWHMIWTSSRLTEIATIIAMKNWDFDSIRVERGEKVNNKELWPNLDRDTSPETIRSVLKGKIEDGRNLYIATDEANVSFFDPLKDKYLTHFLDEYKDLWDPDSVWYVDMKTLNNGNPVEFDGYMKSTVDAKVFSKGKRQIETFNDLTKDCKDGINTCTPDG